MGEGHRNGLLERVLYGGRYRDLWMTPIEVDVLDLSTFAGGLTPLRVGGGSQVRTLHLEGADGRRFVFRSMDKGLGVAEMFRGTLVENQMRDFRVSAFHPAAPMVVSPILESVGVLQATPQLVAMPDDPALGEYRQDYAGTIGLIEERPDEGPSGSPGFAGSERIVSTETLFERLQESSDHRVDAGEFLKVRLIDMWLGDRNRHSDQWRWARFDAPTGYLWRPIPRDRDEAFVANSGLIWAATGTIRRGFSNFGGKISSVVGLTETAWSLDRELLSVLGSDLWEAVARTLVNELTDSVIERAVRKMPHELFEGSGPLLEAHLLSRRDQLQEMAREYYRLISGEVDVYATDENERALIEHKTDGSVTVTLQRIDSPAGPDRVFFQRHFFPDETTEIRIHLRGGNDDATITAEGSKQILVRVIGGDGDDSFVDSATTNGVATKFYDGNGANQFVRGSNTDVDTRTFERSPSADPLHEFVLDWGSTSHPVITLDSNGDHGLVFAYGATRREYGFRDAPYRRRVSYRLGFSADGRFTADYSSDSPAEILMFDARVRISVSGVDRVRFHGFGNDTEIVLSPTGYHRVDRYRLIGNPTLALDVGNGVEFSFGPVGMITDVEDNEDRIITGTEYGADFFIQLGGGAAVEVDRRDSERWPTSGFRLRVDGRAFPALFDVREMFWKVEGEFDGYAILPIPGSPIIAARLGAEKVQGDAPFHEAAYIGGGGTLRGFDRQRFAGDASVYASVELRARLGNATFFSFPTDFGVFALSDVGRVFVGGDSPGGWHKSVGGGIWLAPLQERFTTSVAVARSVEQTAIYINAGFEF